MALMIIGCNVILFTRKIIKTNYSSYYCGGFRLPSPPFTHHCLVPLNHYAGEELCRQMEDNKLENFYIFAQSRSLIAPCRRISSWYLLTHSLVNYQTWQRANRHVSFPCCSRCVTSAAIGIVNPFSRRCLDVALNSSMEKREAKDKLRLLD